MSELISSLGGPTAVARALGIKAPSVIGWAGRVPADRRAHLERHFYPAVTVEAMGDDVHWQRVPDPDWPHPAGRPCIDVARPVPQPEPTAQEA